MGLNLGFEATKATSVSSVGCGAGPTFSFLAIGMGVITMGIRDDILGSNVRRRTLCTCAQTWFGMIGKLTATLLGLIVVSTSLSEAQPPPQIFNNFLNRIQQMQQQQQQQQLLQQQQQYQQQQQQQLLLQQQQQQQDQDARQRAQAEARGKAEADAKARQQQADIDRQKAQADAKARADAQERRNRDAVNKLRADPALVAVLGADKRDVTALIVGKDTQHVVRNMQGDPVFQQNASACLPFGGIASDPSTPEWHFLASVKAAIERKGSAPIVMTACDPADIGRYDLVVFSAGQVANSSLSALSAVIDALRTRQFVTYATFTMANFEAEERAKVAAAQAEQARQAAARDGARSGFQERDPSVVSAIYDVSPAPVVCLIATTDVDGLRYLLKRQDSPFTGMVTADSAIRELASADAIFIAFKRHECDAAIAPAGMLKPMVAAFTRDGVAFEVHTGTIDSDRLAQWRDLSVAELAAEKDAQARKIAEDLRKQQDLATDKSLQRTLEAQRIKNEESSRREELQRRRKLVEPKANADVDMITQRIRRHMDSVVTEYQETKQRIQLGTVLSYQEQIAARSKYVAERLDGGFQLWTGQFEDWVKEGWEFDAIKPTLEDFGQAQWRSRTIEAIAVKVEFPMLNRVIGERRTRCFEFIWINDAEFSFMRNPAAVPCESFGQAFARWSQENSFVSQWNLLPP